MKNKYAILMALLFSAAAGGQSLVPNVVPVTNPPALTNGIKLAWELPADADGIAIATVIFLGHGSRAYDTNWTATGTNFFMPSDWFEIGTNYVTAAFRGVGSSVGISDWSNEIRVIKLQPVEIRVVGSIDGSDDLVSWTHETNFVFSVQAAAPRRFFRPGPVRIEKSAGSEILVE